MSIINHKYFLKCSFLIILIKIVNRLNVVIIAQLVPASQVSDSSSDSQINSITIALASTLSAVLAVILVASVILILLHLRKRRKDDLSSVNGGLSHTPSMFSLSGTVRSNNFGTVNSKFGLYGEDQPEVDTSNGLSGINEISSET